MDHTGTLLESRMRLSFYVFLKPGRNRYFLSTITFSPIFDKLMLKNAA